MPDAEKFGDAGSNTLGHVLHNRELMIENLISLGLGKILNADSYDSPVDKVLGAYGKMAELSPGKDTISGHWELAGLVLKTPFPLYPHGFPAEIIRSFENIIGCKTLGNIAASGQKLLINWEKNTCVPDFPSFILQRIAYFRLQHTRK